MIFNKQKSFPNKSRYYLVIMFIFFVVYLRYFTETLAILPRYFQFLDLVLIIFLIYIFVLWKVSRKSLKQLEFSKILNYYIMVLFISSAINFQRVSLPVLLTYVLLQLGPIAFYIFFMNANFQEIHLRKIIKILFFSAILQLVFAITQIPKALAISADLVSGTFGLNNTQMLSFLSIFVFCLFAYYLCTKNKKILILIGISMFVFFMAGWRALYISLPITVFLVYLLSQKRKRFFTPILTFFLILVTVFYSFFEYSSRFGNTYSYENKNFLNMLRFDYPVYRLGKFKAMLSVIDLYIDQPLTILFGAGPGTYGSRAFRTFYIQYEVKQEVTRGYIQADYSTDVAERYLFPSLIDRFRIGSSTLSSWQSSYVSNFGETGIIGAFLFFGIYFVLFRRLLYIHRNSTDNFSYTVSFGALGAILFLFQISFFDDYIGVFRVSFPVLLLAAITIRNWEIQNLKKKAVSPDEP